MAKIQSKIRKIKQGKKEMQRWRKYKKEIKKERMNE